MSALRKITPCLWFDGQAEQAALFYTSVFKNSAMGRITRYGNVGEEIHGGRPGEVLVVAFELDGQSFTALNGGSAFQFNETISFQVDCADQSEVDYFWEKLGEGGPVECQQCGWVKDKFGVSWQIVPAILPGLLADPDPAKADRTMAALMEMRKLDIAALRKAHAGE